MNGFNNLRNILDQPIKSVFLMHDDKVICNGNLAVNDKLALFSTKTSYT